jgi:hypothetical protein
MRVELSDFVANIYERYQLSGNSGFSRAYWDIRDRIQLYHHDKFIDEIPVYGYICLNELQRVGPSTYLGLFKDNPHFSGSTMGVINSALVWFSNKGIVSAEGLSEDKVILRDRTVISDGITIQNNGFRIAGHEPVEWKNTIYKLNDLTGYWVDI